MENYCISVPEMAKRLGVSRALAYNLINMEGFYPAIRIGKRVLVRVDALQKWLEEQAQTA